MRIEDLEMERGTRTGLSTFDRTYAALVRDQEAAFGIDAIEWRRHDSSRQSSA
jgi:hypothetical protein